MAGGGSASSGEIDLSNNLDFSLYTINADVGAAGLVGNFVSHPTGTGVFDPFLTVDSAGNSEIEMGYNTNGVLYMDQQRPHWNTYLRLGDLAKITIGGLQYYAFELDSNESSGGDKKYISVDNVRIYTSATDTTSGVQSNLGSLDSLGTLRWAMNDPTQNPTSPPSFNIDTWIKLDSTQDGHDGGSGFSDMILYVPVSAFAGALSSDYVWFYNLNGVHYSVDKGLAAEAGFEEWRAVYGPTFNVPDNGGTLLMLGGALLGIGALSRVQAMMRRA
jgi:hypothetical protein